MAKNERAEISAARKAAFAILLEVERGQAHADELLRKDAVNRLSAPDRNLATALVLGVLRWQIRLDDQLQALLKRPNAKLDAEIRTALRMGAFQLFQMDRIPARAAIDESVELAKQAGHHFASGMVNAVLRKLAKSAARFQHLEDDAAELALEQAHPYWMVERWARFFGMDAARGICRHGQTPPAVAVRLVNAAAFGTDLEQMSSIALPPFPQKDAERMGHPNLDAEVAKSGLVLEAGEFLTAARKVFAGEVNTAKLEGWARLQDEGSQLVAELAGGDSDGKVKRILDACAAPGGKTLILAERNPQARIVACEVSAARLAELEKRLEFLGERVKCRQADAAALKEEADFDLVLADVPCSGSGTLGRNPEIRHRLRLQDLKRQAKRQREILAAALRAVRPGGRVIYSTCSLEPEENEQVIAAALAEQPLARVIPLAEQLKALRSAGVLTEAGAEKLNGALTAEGFLRLLPGAFECDGFFVAMLERTA